MSNLERFDVQWDVAEEIYFRDYHPDGQYVHAEQALERIRDLETENEDLRHIARHDEEMKHD